MKAKVRQNIVQLSGPEPAERNHHIHLFLFSPLQQVRNVKSQDERKIPASGLFFAIGHDPATKFLGGQLKLDDQVRFFSAFTPLVCVYPLRTS